MEAATGLLMEGRPMVDRPMAERLVEPVRA
jgi:hypothetical protein